MQIVLALAAWRLRRPVKMVWSRQESLIAHHKRHPMHFKARLGATRDGTLTAASVEVVADGGAYISTSMPVLSNAVLFSTGPYNIPNTSLHGIVVYTNNIPCGAMRGFGALQGNFCAEMQMNKLADALDMDPVELRMRNLITPDGQLPNSSPLPKGAQGAMQTLQKAAIAGGWNLTPQGWQSLPIEPGRTIIGVSADWDLPADGKIMAWAAAHRIPVKLSSSASGQSKLKRVLLHAAGAEVGQGTRTIMTQITADALGLLPDQIEIIGSDTTLCPPAGLPLHRE